MTSEEPGPRHIGRVVVTSFIGTAIEWYDFFLYGTAAALVFPKLFFPELDPLSGTLASFSTYAVGFVARPFGGVIFGHIGDRVGRKAALVTTLMLVGFSTFLIGLIPTYDRIGVWAPILLVTLRFIQGLGVGGEWAGAVLLVVEHSAGSRRGLHASWVQAGAPAGLLLATIVFTQATKLPDADFLEWGWRVPFLLGLVLTGIGLFLRFKILESPIFAKALAEKPVAGPPILEVIRRYPKNVLLAMGARVAENAFFYFLSVFVLNYAVHNLGIEKKVVLDAILVGTICHLVATPMFGALSDRVGRRPVYLGGAIFLAAYAFPFFWLLETCTTQGVWFAIAIGLVGHAAMYGPQAAFLSEMFGTRVRYTGASIGYQLAAPLSGGVAPLIATALLVWSGGSPWPVAVYLIAMAGITITSVALAYETRREKLGDTNPNANVVR